MLSQSSSRPVCAEPWRDGGFGLYIHWPFCESKCPYCDFNSHVAAEIDQRRWRDAYLAEIARYGAETAGRTLQSIYFGGGTPSLMLPETVSRVIEAVRATWPMVNDPEITLEANPTSVEAGRLKAYRAAGVNRISMGVQALNDRDLRALGRRHSIAEARAAFELAGATFERVSLDLIYGRQSQDLMSWRTELREALAMSVDHLSLYQLTIEAGTAFGDRHARGLLRGLPGEDLAADLYEATQEMCLRAGLPAYEVSNHARPGAESRHNLVYWRSGDWIGIGPGAHGRLTFDGRRWATSTELAPIDWLEGVEIGDGAELDRLELSPLDQGREYALMGLRLREGISVSRAIELAQDDKFLNDIRHLEEIEVVERNDDRLVVTDRGRPLLDQVIRQLVA